MSETVQVLIWGSIAFVAGILIIIFRKPIVRFFAEQLTGFGRPGCSPGRDAGAGHGLAGIATGNGSENSVLQ